jgi:hypothetical protein
MKSFTGVLSALLILSAVSPAAGQEPVSIVTVDSSGNISVSDDAPATSFMT